MGGGGNSDTYFIAQDLSFAVVAASLKITGKIGQNKRCGLTGLTRDIYR